VQVVGTDVSVVIPTYRNERFLLAALEAVAAQTVRPGEVVVADDASGDGTEAVVARFATAHPELSVVYVAAVTNEGVVANRNRGIRAARGAWIANCDGDDVWLPHKLERQLAFINGWSGVSPLALVGTWATNVNERLERMSEARMGVTTEAEYDDMMADGQVFFAVHSSVMFRRADFDAVGGYTTDYGFADDFWFFARLAERGVVVNLPEPLLLYRKRLGSLQMVQFFSQTAGLLRLEENLERRRDGRPPVDEEAYATLLAEQPWWRRARRRLRLVGMYHYREGAVALANHKRLAGGLHLMLALVFDGGRVWEGLRGARQIRRDRSASSA
jgi:glycosyltransferase involved in cell wall biosynthesis